MHSTIICCMCTVVLMHLLEWPLLSLLFFPFCYQCGRFIHLAVVTFHPHYRTKISDIPADLYPLWQHRNPHACKHAPVTAAMPYVPYAFTYSLL
ncbi:hypothetical protein BDF22DRAFT_701878, partial [Syncephalis plumigaleata]